MCRLIYLVGFRRGLGLGFQCVSRMGRLVISHLPCLEFEFGLGLVVRERVGGALVL